jgi:putative ABC transport system permease protein
MFCKLAARNVKRSIRDYSVYFLTLTFGVCIFYTFNSLDAQPAMRYLQSTNAGMVGAILQLMDILSVFVAVVLGCLILYANTFLMRRRKRELGLYLMLGLPQSKVSLLLILETLLIGVLALVTGLALGQFLAQGLSALTLTMFDLRLDELQFVFSTRAIGKTCLYFGVIFLVVMAFTGLQISRTKLIDLIRGARKNEEMRQIPLGAAVALFLLGLALVGTAYAMLLIRGLLRVDDLFWLMLAMGTAGTLLIFRSLSGFLLRLAKSHKALYYKGLNMFVLRQFSSRVHTTYLSMTVICLLLLLAIGIYPPAPWV